MVILGLGSNVGDRLFYLRHAWQLIRQIPHFSIQQISPIYISDALLPENAPSSWNMPYLNLALRCETTLTPYDLLHHLKNIELSMGRSAEKIWGPRSIDIDILAWDDWVQYDGTLHIPHEGLVERPFALWPLADIAPRWLFPTQNSSIPASVQGKTATEVAARWGSRFTGEAPLHTKQIAQRIDTPKLVGILNVTPDSFSDGGSFPDVNAAIQHAYSLVESGAEILDIGAEATGPGAIPIDSATEWKRLEAVLTAILAESTNMIIPPKISIDTRHACIANKVLELGVDWINDVSGLNDPTMREVMTHHDCDIVFMHQLGVPANTHAILPPTQDPVPIVYQWAEKNIIDMEQLGISRERLIFDVGIGFGKTAEQSLALIKNIHQFRQLGVRLLVGHSRKSFMNLFTSKPAKQRDIETLSIALYLSNQSVDYLRVHNVEMCTRGLRVVKTLFSE